MARYPSLFPTDVARNRFLALLEHSIEHQVSEFDEERRRFDKKYLLQQANLIAKKEDEILEATNRPTFKSNLLPWEQFLLKGSPGSGIDLPQSLPNVNPLVMPIAGVALHLNWLRNKQIAIEKCGNVSIFRRGNLMKLTRLLADVACFNALGRKTCKSLVLISKPVNY